MGPTPMPPPDATADMFFFVFFLIIIHDGTRTDNRPNSPSLVSWIDRSRDQITGIMYKKEAKRLSDFKDF